MNIRTGCLYRLLAVLAFMALLACGCAGVNSPPSAIGGGKVPSPPPPMPKPVEPPPAAREEISKGTVSYHVWGALLSVGMEQREYPNYAVYTYVLFNSNQPDAASREGERYNAILRAVLLDAKSANVGGAAGWPKDETNIFCIPLMNRNVTKETILAKYDFEISQQYLGAIQMSVTNNQDLLDRLKHRPGPFLMSFYEPMSKLQGKPATRLLYLDLTDMPAAGMREVLDAYRDRLESEPLKNVEKLKESLKIILLNYALRIDENLKIVNAAIAAIY